MIRYLLHHVHHNLIDHRISDCTLSALHVCLFSLLHPAFNIFGSSPALSPEKVFTAPGIMADALVTTYTTAAHRALDSHCLFLCSLFFFDNLLKKFLCHHFTSCLWLLRRCKNDSTVFIPRRYSHLAVIFCRIACNKT